MFALIPGVRANTHFVCSKLSLACLLIAVTSFISFATAPQAAAQAYNGGRNTRALVVQPINEGKLVTLAGNTPGAAIADNDRGPVSDDLPMEHMQLQLQRPPELEQELVNLIDEQQRKGSPEYHHWLTAREFGDRFGVSPQDIVNVSNWLESHGFRVDGVPTSGMMIEFSGTAGQVKQTFHTEIHNLEVIGQAHIANMTDPQIPAALAGVVKGVYALHNFMPHTMLKPRPQFTFTCTAGTEFNGVVVCPTTETFYAVVPADLATIYNLNPAFASGLTGTGQTIAVIEDAYLENISDVGTFRSAFGLSGYSGTFTQKLETGVTTCNNLNLAENSDESEAALDAEWAGASAPGAAVELAYCADTTTVFGGLIALQNLLDGTSPPPIVSISYGECESENGSAANASYSSTYQQAASEGVSVFVSAGDEGAASCDADKTVATHGIAVSGFASTPYNVAVGGTDFGDVYANLAESGPPLSTYWSAGYNAVFGSALSYIPEIPWNDSCASELLDTIEGTSPSYGASGFCNTATGKADFRTTGAGSGGPSSYSAKPAWQSVLGNPNDGVRDLPDVSLFAANGVYNHFFEYCMTDTSEEGGPCVYAIPADAINLAAGGTSFASPIMAGIQALINQSQGALQGNPNPRYYELGNIEYGTTGSPACNSSLGTGVGSSCVFYDVTLGDIDVNCTGTTECYGSSGTGKNAIDGALSTSSFNFSIAYGTTSGWDFATGLGSVNVYNLIQNWDLVQTTTTIKSSSSSLALGESVTFTATVTPAIGSTETGQVTWSSNTGCTMTTLSEGTATCTTTSLPAGTDTVSANYGGDGTYASSGGSMTQTVNPAPIITSQPGATFVVGTAGSFTITTSGNPTPAISEAGALPTGVSFTDNGNGTATINGTPAVGSGGAYSLTITANNGTTNATQNFTLTVDQAPAITSGNGLAINAGGSGAFVVTSTGYPAPTISETGNLPGSFSLTNNGNGRATLGGGAPAGSGGAYPIILTASNGIGSNATQDFTITVKQDVAFTSAATTTFIAGTAGSFAVTTTGYPAPSFSQTGALPNGVNFTDNGNGTASLAGTPAAGTGGSYPIAIHATNSISSPSQSFTLIVDQAPAITSASSAAFVTGTAGTFSVTTTGFPTSALSESGPLPSGVTFTDNGNGTGTLAGTTATSGSFPISITANNGVSPSAAQSFTLTAAVPQYQLATAANPAAGGTVIPASGSLFNQGTVVPIVATPSTGYTFVGWISAGDPVASATSASTTIPINGPESVTAQFAPNLVVNSANDDAGNASNCTAQATPGTNSVDSACRLRDALLAAAGAGAGNISFSGSTFNSANSAAANTILLSNGTLIIPSNTVINGAISGSGSSLTNLVTVKGNAASAVFTVGSGVTGASISGLTITNGSNQYGGGINNSGSLALVNSTISGNTASGAGGGIYNTGSLSLAGSTVSGNSVPGTCIVSASGGGIWNSGNLTVSHSTFTANTAVGCANGSGGAISSSSQGIVTVTASTFTANSADGGGGGIFFSGGTNLLASNILSGNSVPDVSGTYTEGGSDLIGVSNVGLAPLGNYGGPTQTMIPLPGSPAICATNSEDLNIGFGLTDQRGLPLDSNCATQLFDTGAVQSSYALAITTEPSSSATVGVPVSPSPAVTLTESGSVFAPATSAVTMTDAEGALSPSGTNSSPLSSGSATFSNLIFSAAETSDKLTASLTLNANLTPPLYLMSQPSTGVDVSPQPTPLSITVNNASRVYGAANPAFTGTVIGLVSGNPVTISYSTAATTTSAPGNYPIDVTVSGSAASDYVVTVQSGTLTITVAPQTITTTPVTGTQAVGGSVAISASASSGLPVTFTDSTPTVCTLSGDSLSLVGSGTCIIVAHQSGNSDYTAAPSADIKFTVHGNSQTITVTPVTGTQTVGGSVSISASASSGLPVTFTDSTPATCTLIGNTLTLIGSGTCTVVAHQAGNSEYAAATNANISFTVHGMPQTISVTPVTGTQTVGGTVAISASASSGLAVTFTDNTPAMCTLSGNTLTLIGSGACTVVAHQSGNSVYAAAANANISFTVHGMSQTITATPVTGTQLVGANVTLSASASSGLAVSFTTGSATVCSVSGTTATLLKSGTCVVDVKQPGNSQYAAAPTVDIRFTVTP